MGSGLAGRGEAVRWLPGARAPAKGHICEKGRAFVSNLLASAAGPFATNLAREEVLCEKDMAELGELICELSREGKPVET